MNMTEVNNASFLTLSKTDMIVSFTFSKCMAQNARGKLKLRYLRKT